MPGALSRAKLKGNLCGLDSPHCTLPPVLRKDGVSAIDAWHFANALKPLAHARGRARQAPWPIVPVDVRACPAHAVGR
jgi:hypothetical protein